jgi:myo-inositol-1-phosphate synthase
MVFEDRSHINGYLYDFPKIYNNPELKASKNVLLQIDKQIKESKLIDKGEIKWDTSGQINGIITEFITQDNDKYIFAGLSGGEVSNDHYPKYEFLFAEKNNQYELIKKQRFYTDIAGIEGIEYANISPLFSLLLTAIGIIGAIIIGTTNRIIKSRKQKDVVT